MFAYLRPKLSNKRVILASMSKPRLALCEQESFSVEIMDSQYPETLDKASFLSASEYVRATSQGKLDAVLANMEKNGEKWDLVITCDTVVVKDDKIFEKPKDNDEAVQFLKELSGDPHFVLSWVNVAFSGPKGVRKYQEQSVTECDMPSQSAEVFRTYVEELGTATQHSGGYAVQKAGSLMRGVKGEFSNIVGMPMHV